MLDIFRGLKTLIKVSHIHIDSHIFRLHYSVTVIMLMAFSLIVTTRQYVGNPIDCVHTKDIPEDVLNTYCWIHSTYAVKSAFDKKVGIDVPYPGVETSKDEKDKKVYKYYQWVCFCLFFQVSDGVPENLPDFFNEASLFSSQIFTKLWRVRNVPFGVLLKLK